MNLARLALAAAIATVASPALADPPPAYYDATGRLCYKFETCQTLYDLGTVTSLADPNAFLTLGNSPQPSVDLRTLTYSQTSGHVRYSWRLYLDSVANAPNQIANAINADGNWLINAPGGFATVFAQTGIYADLTGDTQTFSQGLSGSNSGTFHLTGTGMLLEAGFVSNGHSYDVYGGNVYIQAGFTSAYSLSRAFIDPVVSPNVAALNNAGYNGDALVQVPDGFGNPGVPAPVFSATPEPAAWALLIGGFGLIGAASRRRRREFAA